MTPRERPRSETMLPRDLTPILMSLFIAGPLPRFARKTRGVAASNYASQKFLVFIRVRKCAVKKRGPARAGKNATALLEEESRENFPEKLSGESLSRAEDAYSRSWSFVDLQDY